MTDGRLPAGWTLEEILDVSGDRDLRWDHVRFTVTTHDAGHRLTSADFDLAHRIDGIARAHDAEPLST